MKSVPENVVSGWLLRFLLSGIIFAIKKILKLIPNKTIQCIIILVVIITSFHSLTGQIQIDFSADIIDGCSPISVAFINKTIPIEGSSFYWDFGNGNFSTATNPQTSYIEPGIYSVKLTVNNNEISETITKEGFITVHPHPTAKFTLIGDTIGCSPSSFAFQDLSSNPDGTTLNYVWSFGDGGKSTEQNPTHTYLTKSVFDVTLLVENQHGCFDSYTESQLIHVFKPTAQFGANHTNSCDGTLTSTFNNISEGSPPLSVKWDFGDGSTSNLFAPTHYYENSGVFSVKLSIEDAYGCSDEIVRQNLIKIVKTSANFSTSKDTLCPSQNLLLTNLSEHADSYLWKFGDQTTANSVNVTKKFQNSGDYTIWLIASQGDCIDSISKTVNIESVKANFTPSDSFLCELPSLLNYIDKSENAISWNWQFGNGTISNVRNPLVNYGTSTKLTNNQASFTDTLITTSKHGCTDRMIKENSVSIHIPDVKFSPGSGGNNDELKICIPFELSFTDKTEYTTPYDYITEKQWYYNGQPIGTSDQSQITVNQIGKIPVDLTIITAKGCVQKKTEIIQAGQKLSPDFYRVGDYNVCASEPVDFVVTSPESSLITNGSWNFGDGSTDMLQMPPHNFIKTGPMDVIFTVFNYGCRSSITKHNIVNILGPVVSYNALIDCSKPLERVLQGTIKEATSYIWSFGDNSNDVTNQNNIKHSFPAKGEYKVVLSANNSGNNCSYNFSRVINIRDIKSDFDITDGTPCLNNTLTIDGSNSVDAINYFLQNDYGKYLWHIKEENKTYFTTGTVSHKFIQKGVNNISLIVKDINGCTDTLKKEVIIYNPEPDFEANYKVGCMPITFEFKDLSQSLLPIYNWLWNFGDGTTSTDQNPVHDYTDYGSYNISLKISDEIGCNSTLSKSQLVQAIFPDASFSANDNTLCPGDSSRFYDISNSKIDDYTWVINDGRSSKLEKPLFYFEHPGYYTVSLKIIDNHGCETTKTINNYVHVQPFPKADFGADITNSNCYPLIVQFYDQSANEFPGSWKWSFGENDNLSELKNPFFIYNRPGHHDVQLICQTTYGCSDTIIKQKFIDVGGPFATVGIKDTVCKNMDVLFTAENQLNIYDIRWDFGDGYLGSGNEAVHQYQNAGIIYPVLFLRSDEDNTCNKAIVDTLNILDLQAVFSLKDGLDKGCVPFEPQLENTSLNSTGWIWDFGNGTLSEEKTPQYKYTEAGSFNMRLTALHSLGCSDTTDWIQITVHPLPIIKTNKDTIICVGSSAELWASGGLSYSWIPPESLSNPLEAKTKATPPISSLYQVKVADENGCTNYKDVMVSVQQIPKVSLKDTSLIIGEFLGINIADQSLSSYFWTPPYNISCTSCPNPVLHPLNSTTYNVMVTDTSNCFTVSYPLNITILKQYSVDVPKAFTPNGDGINDKIFVKGWGIKELISFKIFNRLGQEVYSSSSLEEGWDGFFKGKSQAVETYNYNVKIKTYEGETLTKSGVFKLLR